MKDDEDDKGPPNLLAAQNELEQHLASTELGFEVVVAEKLEQRGIYDLTRLRQRKPEIAKACRQCILVGVATGTIADLLSLDIRTVNLMRDELEAEGAITPYKKNIVRQLRAVITMAVDSLFDLARAGKLTPLDICMLADKVELLSGGATARVEHRASPEEEETLEFYESLRTRSKALGSGMVIEAEVIPQTGAPAVPIPAPLAIATELQQRPESVDQGPERPLGTPAEPSK